MQFQPKPPAIPAELLSRFGDAEHVFGPNVKFRVVAAVCGGILLIMGVFFFVLGLSGMPLSNWISGQLTVPLVVLGAAVLIGTRLVPLHWVFVCPRGLLRRRGGAWDSVRWAEVERFEDATLDHQRVVVRQCRIVTIGGSELGFLADQTAEYSRLAEVLRRKIDEWRQSADPGGAAGTTGGS